MFTGTKQKREDIEAFPHMNYFYPLTNNTNSPATYGSHPHMYTPVFLASYCTQNPQGMKHLDVHLILFENYVLRISIRILDVFLFSRIHFPGHRFNAPNVYNNSL